MHERRSARCPLLDPISGVCVEATSADTLQLLHPESGLPDNAKGFCKSCQVLLIYRPFRAQHKSVSSCMGSSRARQCRGSKVPFKIRFAKSFPGFDDAIIALYGQLKVLRRRYGGESRTAIT